MIGLYRFLETKDFLCKFIIVLCNIFIVGIALYGIKIFFTGEKLFEPVLYFIAIFSAILQIDLLVGFKNKKKVHVGSLDYYMSIINPSYNKLMNIIDSFFKLNKKDGSEKNWIEIILVSTMIITVFILVGKMFINIFEIYFLFFVFTTLINYAIFSILNKEKLYAEKLNLVKNISDIEMIEEIKYDILACIRTKGFICKNDMLKIYMSREKNKEINYDDLFI